MKNLKSGKRKNDVILDRTQVLSGHVYAPKESILNYFATN